MELFKLRQLFVACATWLAALSGGGATSYPTILLHQLRRHDSSIQLDFDTASWIGSIHGLAGIPCILLPIIMQWRGRKMIFIAACVPLIFGWIVMYTAQSVKSLLIAESFLGLGTNGLLVVSILTLTETISPSYRHVSVLLYGVVQWIAMAINGLLIQYLHWRSICVVMCIPACIALAIGSMWPESPYWLAVTGKFDRCEKSFTWIRGKDECSMKELKLLISVQKEVFAESRTKQRLLLKLSNFARRDFFLPMFYMFVLLFLTYWSGSFVFLIYSVDIIRDTTRYENVAQFGGFIISVIMCLGLFVCMGLSRYFTKKKIMLSCTGFAVVCLLGATIVSYLQSVSIMPEKSLICFCFLIGFTIATAIGICPIAYLLAAELIPVKHRGFGGALMELCNMSLYASALKLAPYLILNIHISGTFLLYTVNTLFCGLIIWRFVPETTGRTLQEIEDYHNLGKYVNRQLPDRSDVEFFEH